MAWSLVQHKKVSAATGTSLSAAFASTTVAVGSNGVNVSTFAGAGTLNVAATAGFPAAGTLQVATSGGNARITYTGTTGTSFTGCTTTSGTGTLSTGGAVHSMTTAGNLLLLFAVVYIGGGSVTFGTPTDTAGNTWTNLYNHFSSNVTVTGGVWGCVNTAATPSDSISVSWGTAATLADVFIAEFSGISGSTPTADGSTAQTDSAVASASIVSPTYTPAVAGDLVLSFGLPGDSVSAFGGSWNAIDIAAAGSTTGSGWAYIADTGTTAETASWTQGASSVYCSAVLGIETGGSSSPSITASRARALAAARIPSVSTGVTVTVNARAARALGFAPSAAILSTSSAFVPPTATALARGRTPAASASAGITSLSARVLARGIAPAPSSGSSITVNAPAARASSRARVPAVAFVRNPAMTPPTATARARGNTPATSASVGVTPPQARALARGIAPLLSAGPIVVVNAPAARVRSWATLPIVTATTSHDCITLTLYDRAVHQIVLSDEGRSAISLTDGTC